MKMSEYKFFKILIQNSHSEILEQIYKNQPQQNKQKCTNTPQYNLQTFLDLLLCQHLHQINFEQSQVKVIRPHPNYAQYIKALKYKLSVVIRTNSIQPRLGQELTKDFIIQNQHYPNTLILLSIQQQFVQQSWNLLMIQKRQKLEEFFKIQVLLKCQDSEQILSTVQSLGLSTTKTSQLIHLLLGQTKNQQYQNKHWTEEKHKVQTQLNNIVLQKQAFTDDKINPYKQKIGKNQTTKQYAAPIQEQSKTNLVDINVPNHSIFSIHYDDKKIYNCTLNKCLLDSNTAKFYIIQILVKNNSEQYYIWNRWGRVGVLGQNILKGPVQKNDAIQDFYKKKAEKLKCGYSEIMLLNKAKQKPYQIDTQGDMNYQDLQKQKIETQIDV